MSAGDRPSVRLSILPEGGFLEESFSDGRSRKRSYSTRSLHEFATDVFARRTNQIINDLTERYEALTDSHRKRGNEKASFTSEDIAEIQAISRFVGTVWRADQLYTSHRNANGWQGIKTRVLRRQPNDIRKRNEFDRAKCLLATPFRLFPGDRKIVFDFFAEYGLSRTRTLPIDPDDFVHAFVRLHRTDHDAFRSIVEESWKCLNPLNEGLPADEKYRVSDLLLRALDHTDLAYLRNDPDVSWSYCMWYKYRWLAAKELAEKQGDASNLEESCIEWLELCYRTPVTEQALKKEVDTEKEIRNAIFESGHSLHPFLLRRESERKTLTRIAQWFYMRYDFKTAFLIARQLRSLSTGQIPNTSRGTRAVRRPANFRTGYVLASLAVLVILAGFSGQVLETSFGLSVPVGMVLPGLFLTGLIATNLNFALISLNARLLGSCFIGWLPLMSDEFWRIPFSHISAHSWFIPVALVFALLIPTAYIVQRVNRLSVRRTNAWRRRAPMVIFVALLFSGAIGAAMTAVAAGSIIEGLSSDTYANGAVANCIVHERPCAALFLSEALGVKAVYESPLSFPFSLWLFYTPIAVFIGLFLETLWGDRPITEPL